MKNKITYWIMGVVAMSLVPVLIAAPADVQPPKKREQIVEQANQLSKTVAPEAAQPPENLRNPFSPIVVEEVRTVRPTSDKDLLLILAEQIQPSGVMGMAGSLMLTRKGQKPVKLNEKLTLSFDGAMYDVEVIAIDNTSFSLRYNQTEITRPINKTGKNP